MKRDSKMTYGEYHYLVKYDMKLKDGVWVTCKPNSTIPSQMSREEASSYYNEKFKAYWASKSKDDS